MEKILNNGKTYEIRNMNCMCVKPNETFYLIKVPMKGDGKNTHGQSCLEVVGEAIFKGNHFIPHESFADLEQHHRVSQDQYDSMRKVWKKDRGGCTAWEIELSKRYEPSVWLPHRCQESSGKI